MLETQDMETYIYMPPVKIGDSFQKHKIELIRQKEKQDQRSIDAIAI